MKKLISFILCACIISGFASLPASAVSLDDGREALISEFLDGECPDNLDYVYFEPKDAQESNKKYPLVVWLHGNSSGSYPREQIIMHDFNKWASDEYQSRFKDTGGAYLLLPRSNLSSGKWSAALCPTLKETIDYFIAQNKEHIDTSRISIMGYSSGGSMVNYMLGLYPSFFAAAVPMCSIYIPNPLSILLTRNVSIWYFASVFDIYVLSGSVFATLTFLMSSLTTSKRSGVRITNFSKAVWADGTSDSVPTKNHKVWGAVTNDMHMNDGRVYINQSTFDANFNKISFEDGTGVIDWLYQQKRPS